GELRQARAEVASQKESVRRLEAKLKDLDPKTYLADQKYKFTKASFDAERYKYEDKLANDPRSAPRAKKDLDALVKELDEKTVTLATFKKQEAGILAQMDGIKAHQKELETTIEKKTAAFRLSRSKYVSLKQDALFQL